MAEIKKYIAVDLGAESGRVMLGSVSAEKLVLQEVHRFDNGPTEEDGSLHWDFDELLSQIRCGIGKATKQAGAQVWGIGVDTWGVDFGLIGSDGKLIENPYHYRDSRTDGMCDKAYELMPKREIYENTGLQFMQMNTVFQLLSMRLANSAALAKATHLLFVPDLVSYHLCGKVYSEYTIASTSQLMDMKTGRWSENVFEALSLPLKIMSPVVQPGTVVGQLTASVGSEIGCGPIPIIAVGAHDTASAVAAVPAGEGNWAYFSCGTWSLIGVEVPRPYINDKTFEHNFTNEGGVEGTIRLLKNVVGLWLVQECKRQWEKDGQDYSYAELADMAREAKQFNAYIDPNDARFLPPGEMPTRINEYLAESGQKTIDDKGLMVRAVLEGLAFRARWVIEKLEDIMGESIDVIHMVGGGIQNELLCQFVANATGKEVIAGPVEATASGNILMQAKATGQIKSISQMRDIVRKSFAPKHYAPQDVAVWDKHYKKMEANY
jgi:sugar (pentulose or hexulose) kinase